MQTRIPRVAPRRAAATACAALCALLWTLLPPPASAQDREGAEAGVVLDKIVASVDDEAILLSDLLIDVQGYIQQTGQRPDSSQFMAMLDEALTNRVSEKLLVAKARRDEVQVGEDELERSMDAHIARLAEQAGGRTRFEFELEREGLTERDLRRKLMPDMKDQLLVQRVLERISYEVTATEEETRAYFDANSGNPDVLPRRPAAVTLSHILVKPRAQGERAEAVRALVDQVRGRLAAGEDFGAIAKELSEGPAAERGGDLGWFNLKDIGLQALREALNNMAVGEVADNVISAQGHHIVEVLERTGGRVHFRQIFFPITLDDSAMQGARARAREAHGRLAAGEAWEAVVAEYSDDAMTRDAGGLLPEVAEEQLDDLYRGIVQALEPGEYSSPFQSERGYQIIRLEAREASRPFRYDEVAEQLRMQLINQRRSEMLDTYLEELRGEINIETFGVPSFDEIAGMGG